MTIKKFISSAIKGGWECPWVAVLEDTDLASTISLNSGYLCEALLDPKAWESVGKVEGWTDAWHSPKSTAREKMHDMIDALVDGYTLEDFIETL